MGRSGGILDSIVSILEAMGISLPPWAGPVIALSLMALLLPLILRNFKITRARKILQRSRVFQPKEQSAAGQEALDLVRNIPMGLVAVADEALRQERGLLAREAVRCLVDSGRARDHARRLVRVLEEEGSPGSPAELALLVERLAQEGMLEAAGARLQRGLERWPRDEGLRAWQDRIESQKSSQEPSEIDD